MPRLTSTLDPLLPRGLRKSSARPARPSSAPGASLTITQVSRATGIASSALRYYESLGLLRPIGRTKAGYRLYAREATQQLDLVRAAQATGLTLEAIGELLSTAVNGAASCPTARQALMTRLQEVRTRIRELRRVESTLKSALASCSGSTTKDICKSFCSP